MPVLNLALWRVTEDNAMRGHHLLDLDLDLLEMGLAVFPSI